MAAGRRIARFDRVHRGLHEALEDLADLLIQDRVFQGDSGLRGQRGHELLTAFVEWDYAALEVVLREQLLLGLTLLVDQLQYADHLSFAGDERSDQHAARAIADLLIERAIEAER